MTYWGDCFSFLIHSLSRLKTVFLLYPQQHRVFQVHPCGESLVSRTCFPKSSLTLAGFWHHIGLRWWLSGKESACNARDPASISGSGRAPGEGHGNSLQYSRLGNSKDRGAQQATVHGVAKELDTT